MKAWVYRTEREGSLITEGVIGYCVDVDIELLIGISTDSDRCLWEVQSFLDEYYKDKGYVFTYKEIELDLDKLFEVEE